MAACLRDVGSRGFYERGDILFIAAPDRFDIWS